MGNNKSFNSKNKNNLNIEKYNNQNKNFQNILKNKPEENYEIIINLEIIISDKEIGKRIDILCNRNKLNNDNKKIKNFIKIIK